MKNESLRHHFMTSLCVNIVLFLSVSVFALTSLTGCSHCTIEDVEPCCSVQIILPARSVANPAVAPHRIAGIGEMVTPVVIDIRVQTSYQKIPALTTSGKT